VVPTRYDRQAIRLSSKVIAMDGVYAENCLEQFQYNQTYIRPSISNRVVDVKRCCLCLAVLYIGQVRRSCIHVEAFHHTQSILLYGQAARAISIG
jgi:hypothetical protein